MGEYTAITGYLGMISGCVLLLVMLFFGLSAFKNIGYSVIILILGTLLVMIALIFLGEEEAGAGFFAMIIGGVILFAMLFWGLFVFGIDEAVVMIGIGTILVVMGVPYLSKHEAVAGLFCTSIGFVILLVAILFGVFSVFEIGEALGMTTVGAILVFSGVLASS